MLLLRVLPFISLQLPLIQFIIYLQLLPNLFYCSLSPPASKNGAKNGGSGKSAGGGGGGSLPGSSDYMYEHMTVLEEIHMLEKLVDLLLSGLSLKLVFLGLSRLRVIIFQINF